MTNAFDPPSLSEEQSRQFYMAAADHFFKELNGVKENEALSSIGRFYRFENLIFQKNAEEWVRCLSFIDSDQAKVQIAALFFGAFFWEGETVPYAPCLEFLALWRRTRVHQDEQSIPKMADMMEEFYKIFPRETEREGKPEAQFRSRWQRTTVLLEEIRSRLGSEEADKNDLLLSGVDAIILKYLALARDYSGMSGYIKQFKQSCLKMRNQSEDLQWGESYTRLELAYSQLKRARIAQALGAIRESYMRRDDEPEDGEYPDREIEARIAMALGEAFWALGHYKDAVRSYSVAIHQIFLFLYTQPTILDAYTCEMYLLICRRLSNKLRHLYAAEPDQVVSFCHDLHEFWYSYRLNNVSDTVSRIENDAIEAILLHEPIEAERQGSGGMFGLIFPVLSQGPREVGKQRIDGKLEFPENVDIPQEVPHRGRFDEAATREMKEMITLAVQMEKRINITTQTKENAE